MTSDGPSEEQNEREGVRLQKVLAAAGFGSRRACEQLIDDGRVSVNGQPVLQQGVRVRPEQDVLHVDGMRVPTAAAMAYLMLNKPRGMVSAMTDPEGRPNIGDVVRGRSDRLFHVGRLDADTEGLILLTNDGELGNRLTHPSYGVQKTYLADIAAPVPRDLGKRLRAGIELEDGLARADSFKVVGSAAGRALVEVVLHEGRKHVVRRMLAEAGHPVSRLVRTQFGPIPLGELRPGKTRRLTRDEVGRLYAAVGM
ncbi:MAG: rRNA pseudouridine synthase [Actinomycetota bacterium]|nr:rRNA pseudouridine synthase [Actinomycetota bacterium]